jgi:hypothetical protein
VPISFWFSLIGFIQSGINLGGICITVLYFFRELQTPALDISEVNVLFYPYVRLTLIKNRGINHPDR